HAPGKRPVHAADAVDQAGLARAVGSDDGDQLARANLHAHVLQRVDAAEPQGNVRDLEARRRRRCNTRLSSEWKAGQDDRMDPRHKSRTLLDGPDRAPARAMLKAIGFSGEDLARPLVAVANTWTETMPCNFHLRRLAERVKEGIRAAGGTPMEFNTIAISDGITMGTEGMKASLVSREVIADSIELVARGHLFDGVVGLSGCDKTIPG